MVRYYEQPVGNPVLGASVRPLKASLQFLQFALLTCGWGMARLLPPAVASGIGRTLFMLVGPHHPRHRHVRRNIAQALGPATPDALIDAAAVDVWGNLGSVVAEYPHLRHIARHRLEIDAHPEAEQLLANATPTIYLSGHLGNWELAAAAIARLGVPMSVIYSAQSNAWLDAAIQRKRRALGVGFIEKDGALRELLRAFAAGQSLGLLPDQRVDHAAMVPLCGLPAPTTISAPRLAGRFGCPVVPIWIERIGPARYRAVFEAPIRIDPALSRKEAGMALMEVFHGRLEERIRRAPGQWLCLKRRWREFAGHRSNPVGFG